MSLKTLFLVVALLVSPPRGLVASAVYRYLTTPITSVSAAISYRGTDTVETPTFLLWGLGTGSTTTDPVPLIIRAGNSTVWSGEMTARVLYPYLFASGFGVPEEFLFGIGHDTGDFVVRAQNVGGAPEGYWYSDIFEGLSVRCYPAVPCVDAFSAFAQWQALPESEVLQQAHWEFSIEGVPEPGTLCLVLLGFLGVARRAAWRDAIPAKRRPHLQSSPGEGGGTRLETSAVGFPTA
jgi:PEP-CTERM motif